jgi:hypothetical protein
MHNRQRMTDKANRIEDAKYQLPGYELLGCGPQATGSYGWARSGDLIFRCAKCGTTMPSLHNDYFNCSCGAMHLDIDAGRFGSQHGDESILVYRRLG